MFLYITRWPFSNCELCVKGLMDMPFLQVIIVYIVFKCLSINLESNKNEN